MTIVASVTTMDGARKAATSAPLTAPSSDPVSSVARATSGIGKPAFAAKPAITPQSENCEPTQGVDVGAKAEIHRLMGELARQGLAIVMISSELPEILGMSDRIAVMHGGTIVGTLDRDAATQEAILELALGHAPATAVAS